MNRNQKIALGCGGAGCLGLIVLSVVGVIGYLTYYKTGSSPFANTNENSNVTVNINSDDANQNGNTSVDDADISMSEDDKHKLFQAAGVTKDNELILKVLEKIGFPSGTGPGYEKFIGEHFPWAMKNLEFMQSVNTPEKGRAYVEAHLDD